MGFVSGKDFSSLVNFANIRPPSCVLTNQCRLNVANEETVYKRLRKTQFPEANLMTLWPIYYILLRNGFVATRESYVEMGKSN